MTERKSDEEKRAIIEARKEARAKAEEAKSKRLNGFLVCDTCQTSTPYQGLAGQPDSWPQHRCRPLGAKVGTIRPFDRLDSEDPNRPPIRAF